MSSPSGQTRRMMAEELRTLDLEVVSQQRGRTEGIIIKALRDRDGTSSSSVQIIQSWPTMAEVLGKLELALVSQRRRRIKRK